jgi:hypothetical protein
MCIHMLTKRTNLLFEEDLWQTLTAIASQKNTSVGDLVRKAVRRVYIDTEKVQTRKQAIEKIFRIRKIQKKPVNYKALINYGRKYI